jgi:galactose-1-phosphate uridylyltransferase
LTGQTSIIRKGRLDYAKFYGETDYKLILEISEKSRDKCFFCPEKVDKNTPKFPSDIIPEGRIHVGEAWVFPNLFAQFEFSAITVLSQKHFLKLDEFSPQILHDAFKASMIYIEKIFKTKPTTKYAVFALNYLFPAGASLVHPHMQILAGDIPFYINAELLQNSQRYYNENSVNYWKKLVEAERNIGQRYLGKIGGTHWLVPFSPTRRNEVHAIIENKSNFLEFNDDDLKWFAKGLSKVLKYYHDQRLSSFNFILYSGPLGERLDYFWAGLKVISRQNVQSCYLNDAWYGPYLLLDGYLLESPEELAEMLRPYFKK